MYKAVNWIHLSDWHQRGPDFDRTVVRDALIRDIAERSTIDPRLEQIDLIFFTGDLAYAGKADEFAVAREEFLNRVLDAAGLPGRWDRLFLIPGNHDLDRDKVASLLKTAGAKPAADLKAWCEGDAWQLAALLTPFSAFSKMVAPTAAAPHTGDPSYGWLRDIKVNGVALRIMGFNTALLSSHFRADSKILEEYGLLGLGEPQVYKITSVPTEAEIVIGLIHHPFEWLTEKDRCTVEQHLLDRCQFLLHGHQHRPRASVALDGRGDCVLIPGGAAYDRRIPEDPHYAQSFNFVSLQPNKRTGCIFFRRWSEPAKNWLEDLDTKGKFYFSIPKRRGAGVPHSVQESTAILNGAFAEYLTRRPFERYELTVSLEPCNCHPDSPLLELHISQTATAELGKAEELPIHAEADGRASKIIASLGYPLPPFKVFECTIDGNPIEPVEQGEELLFVGELPSKRSTVKYRYWRHVAAEGHYRFQVQRFTRRLELRVDNRSSDTTLGGYPVGLPAFATKTLIDSVVMTAQEVLPHSGYLLHWTPVLPTQ